jgi:CheY-like chemotaxis protein
MAKILLVEDDKLLLKLMTHRLQKVNFEVVTATDGHEALEKAAAEMPDLILMDIRLPSLDGWEATKKIKSSPDLAHIPVIALTAQSSAMDRERSLAVGCDDYAAKPIQFPLLVRQIEALLQKQPG